MKWRRGITLISTLVIALIGVQATLALFGVMVGINLTASQPYTLFLVLKGRSGQKGDRIAFRFPGSRYYREGTLFIKEIRGIQGDHLEVREDRTVWLNGNFLDTVRATDSQGRPVEPFRFDGVIPGCAYFLYSPARNSYDSRYYGLVRKERIVGRVIALL